MDNEGIILNERTHILTVDGKEVYLPPIQWRLLARLMAQPGDLCTFHQLGDAAWSNPDTAFLAVTSIRERIQWHMAQLKLRLGAKADSIQMFPGFGYKFHLKDQ